MLLRQKQNLISWRLATHGAVAVPAGNTLASRREELRTEVRLRVLRLIKNDPNLSTRGIANQVGISNGTAYYVISSLIKKGMIKAGNIRRSRSKLEYAYILTRRGVREKAGLTAYFLRVKLIEFDLLKQEINEIKIELEGDRHFNQMGT